MKQRILSFLCLCLLLLPAARALAADPPFPVRPVQIIVPYNAGGATDLSVRILGEVAKKYIKTTFVVVNQPGGGGSIGTSAVSHAKPDGYTLGSGSQGPLTLLPHYGGIDYNKDSFEYFALLGRNLMCVAVPANSPFKTIKDLIAHAKANPGKVSIANSGAGGANHIAAEGFAEAAGIKIKSMPFNGGSPAVTACVGGHVDATTAHPSELANHVKAGSLRVLTVMEAKRIKEFPDVPTTVESGVNFQWASWKGIIGPRNIPAGAKKALVDAFAKAMKDPEFLGKMAKINEDVEYMDPAQYKALADRDAKVAEKIIRDLGMYEMNLKKK